MIRIPLHSLLAAAAISAGTAYSSAQSLDREIAVNRELLPTAISAERLPFTPVLELPPVDNVTLSPDMHPIMVNVPGEIHQLDPALWSDAHHDCHRGMLHASLGGPYIDGRFAASGKFIDTGTSMVRGRAMWTSEVYRKGNIWRNHSGLASVDGAFRLGDKSLLRIYGGYRFNRVNMPVYRLWQTDNRANLKADWHSRSQSVSYDVTAAYTYFGYNGRDAARQHLAGIHSNVAFATGSNSDIFIKADGEMLVSNLNAATQGLISITSGWEYGTREWRLSAAPHVDFTINRGYGGAVHIAPNVRAAWIPNSFFAIDVNLGGGGQLNSLARLSCEAPRQATYMVYAPSNIPMKVEGGITAGPMRGAWVRVAAGWAKARHTLMPSALEDGIIWTAQQMNGFHADISAGATVCSLLKVEATYRYSDNWYETLDRAHHTVKARLSVNPVSNVTACIDYELRGGRRLIDSSGILQRISSVNLLNLTVDYSLNNQITLFASGVNLLNTLSPSLDLTPSSGTGARIGARIAL